MKIKDLYDPTVSSGVVNGFIRAIDTVRSFGSLWFEELDEMGRVALDNYIMLKIGNKEVLEIIESLDTSNRLRFMSDILRSYNYQLDGLWRLLIPNDSSDLGYNPLDNVFEVRHEKTDRGFDKGIQVDIVEMDDRKMRVNNPNYTDETTTSGTTTAFDTGDYDKATEKNVTSFSHGANTIETTSDGTTDTNSTGSRHDDESIELTVNRHGNIGVTTSFELVSGDRKLHYYNFFNEVVNVIVSELTTMNWY